MPEIAGELAGRLCALSGGQLEKVYFGSSGSEGVEAAIKFARAATGRDGIVFAKSSFHGLTAGALSLMNDAFWRDGFGPLLADTRGVPYGDAVALESALASKRQAAFVVEPLQAEEVRCPRAPTYRKRRSYAAGRARSSCWMKCRRECTVPGHFWPRIIDVLPDMVVMAKALSGGLMPVSAVLMTDKIYHSVYSSLKRAVVHTSTFGENSLSMRAGLATLDVLEREDLGTRALQLGETFRAKLRCELAGFEMVGEVRGMGLLSGIEFVPPKKFAFRALYEGFNHIHPAMFGQIVVMRMFREKGILTQICGNNFMVLKAAPPLTVTSEQLDEFVSAIRDVVELAQTSPGFWTEALSMARRAVNI